MRFFTAWMDYHVSEEVKRLVRLHPETNSWRSQTVSGVYKNTTAEVTDGCKHTHTHTLGLP